MRRSCAEGATPDQPTIVFASHWRRAASFVSVGLRGSLQRVRPLGRPRPLAEHVQIVVTGATGHLGRLVVESLTARGVPATDITATGRSTDKPADLAGQHRNAIDAASRAGVAHVVYTSGPKADTSTIPLLVDHRATE